MGKLKALFIILLGLAVASGTVQAIEFDMSNGAITMHYVQHNPIGVKVEDGKNGSLEATFDTNYYELTSELKSEGQFETSMIVLAGAFSQSSWGKEEGEPTTKVNATISQIRDEEPKDKMVKVKIETTKAEKGILKVNYLPQERELDQRSNAQMISDKLGVSGSKARDLIGKYGPVKILDAVDVLEGYKKSNRNPGPAGGAGGISGPNGVVSVDQLSPQELFTLYLDGVKYEGHVRYNSLFLTLYHPSNGNKLNHLHTKVTLEGPVSTKTDSKEPANVVLMGSLKYEEGTGYRYPFGNGDWLVAPENLPSGPYKLHIDVDRVKHLTLPVKLTKDNTVVPR